MSVHYPDVLGDLPTLNRPQPLDTGPSVLLVDDDPDLRVLLTLSLEQAGFQVWSRADGTDVVRAALSLRPTIIVLDSVLPRCSGRALCAELRSLPELEGVGIIMMAARSHEDDVLGTATGADRYVTKPIVTRLLVRHAVDLFQLTCPAPSW